MAILPTSIGAAPASVPEEDAWVTFEEATAPEEARSLDAPDAPEESLSAPPAVPEPAESPPGISGEPEPPGISGEPDSPPGISGEPEPPGTSGEPEPPATSEEVETPPTETVPEAEEDPYGWLGPITGTVEADRFLNTLAGAGAIGVGCGGVAGLVGGFGSGVAGCIFGGLAGLVVATLGGGPRVVL